MRSRAQTVPKNPSNTANFMRGPRQNSKNDGRLIEDWRLSLTLSPSGWQSWLSWLRLLAYLTVFATLQTLPQLIKLVSFNKFHEIYFLECSVRLWEIFLATIVIPNCIHPMIMTAFLRGTPNTAPTEIHTDDVLWILPELKQGLPQIHIIRSPRLGCQ